MTSVDLDSAATRGEQCCLCGRRTQLTKSHGDVRCYPCALGPCVTCGGRSASKNPHGDGGVCNGCRYGDCVKCGSKASSKNPEGIGGVCNGCRYGTCVTCGNRASRKNPDGDGGVCDRCRYGNCVRCAAKASRPNPDGPGGVCQSHRWGDCVNCGNKANRANPAGPGGICNRCHYGDCVVCGHEARNPNPDGEGSLCNVHARHGVDHKTQPSWQESTRFFYVVDWAEAACLKGGVGVSEDRHSGWLRGGAVLVRLIALAEGETDGTILVTLESRWKQAARVAGFTHPDRSEFPEVLHAKKNKGSEVWRYSSVEERSALIDLLVNTAMDGLPVVEIDPAEMEAGRR